MLASFRRHLNSWVARAFFMLLIAVFVLWGVGDVIRNIGVDTSVATVYGRKIEMPEVQAAYQRQLAQLTRMFGGKVDPTADMRKGVAAQAIEQIITQTAMAEAVTQMGLAVSDDALRQATYEVPAFHNSAGQFDRTQFEAALRNNNMTEGGFLQLLRADLGQRQLVEAVRAGVVSPDTLTREVYAYQQEKRVADAVEIPFTAAAAPPAPSEEQLSRWYDNHKELYSTPEYRRIKAVILAPETVEKDMQVSDDDLKAAYEQHRAEYSQPERRSVQVLLTPDEDTAKKLQAQWEAGADWNTMQKLATPAELNDATKAEFPAPELGEAVFAAAPDTVPPPVHSALGWHVLKVTKVTPGNEKTLDQVHDVLRAQVLADKAADVIYDRAGKVEDLLAGGTALDDLPADLGLSAVTGTLDAKGLTTEGQPAPIPGSDALRQALVQAAFQMKKGDPPHLTEGPHEADGGQAYFAVDVEDITPPAPKPQEQVADAVRADWTRDAAHHEQEEIAAKILTEVKSGTSLADAATGLTVQHLPAVLRTGGAEGVPTQLVEPLFSLKQGEPTMVETADGFMVAVLAEVQDPDPNADAIGYGQVRDALTKALGDDVQAVLTQTLRDRGKPKVNSAMIDSIAQAD